MSRDLQHRHRVIRQQLETDRLLGADAVPLRARAAVTVEPAEPAADLFRAEADAPETTAGPGVDPPPEIPAGEKPEALEALRQRHDAECRHCTTAAGHTQTVFGEGDPDAALMFVGEAPGEEEDRTGRPFVGRAGRKLDDMIRAMGCRREDVYIANVLKSRPPGNRTPLPTEVEACCPYLAEQIAIIRPAVIVALGGPATKWLLQTRDGITRLRGTWSTYARGPIRIPVMPTFHPAYLLRQYTAETRGKVWSDLQAAMARLSG